MRYDFCCDSNPGLESHCSVEERLVRSAEERLVRSVEERSVRSVEERLVRSVEERLVRSAGGPHCCVGALLGHNAVLKHINQVGSLDHVQAGGWGGGPGLVLG